jgi:hypothetical protein
MLTPWEIVGKEMIPPGHLVKSNFKSTAALFKVLLLNRAFIKKLNGQQAGKTHAPPARKYDLPAFAPGMVNRSTDKKYLRPTLYCNCRAPEITAMAEHLGLGKKTDREFAEAAFDFTKRNITVQMIALDDVDTTLMRGTGSCLQKIAVFVALCRAGGIPARFKFCALSRLDDIFTASLQNAPLVKKWFDAMGNFLLHGEGEIYLDGRWVIADISSGPQWQAAASLPITRLGETSIDLWIFPVPGSIFIRESLCLGMRNSTHMLFDKFLASSIPGFNLGFLEQIEKGRKIIETAGGEAAYDAVIRRTLRPVASQADLLREHENIVFEKK